MDRLAVHKALGDPTRDAIYRALAASSQPLSVRDLADRLDLHPNTVRPHLEQMREVELVVVEAVHRGTVGRPEHRYSIAPGAPGAGIEPPSHTLLAGLLGALAERSGVDAEAAAATGRAWGEESLKRTPADECARQLLRELDHLGFEPASAQEGPCLEVAFQHCPFRELAEAYPELVCNLHRGLIEGIVGARGVVDRFGALYDRDPCSVSVTIGYPGD
jgi:predicted ArsR family transcriptional regulator